MFFLFFTYCNANSLKTFLKYDHAQVIYKQSLKKIPNAKLVNPLWFLQDFSIFFTKNFEKFFLENTLNIKNLEIFFKKENIHTSILSFIEKNDINSSKESIKANEVFMKFATSIMEETYTQIIVAFNCLIKFEQDYEKKMKSKKDKVDMKDFFSSYSIPEKFKDQEKSIYTNFYSQTNKSDFFAYIDDLVHGFISESLSQKSLKQKSDLQQLFLNYFLSELQLNINNSFLYLVNKDRETLPVGIDIKLGEDIFLFFKKTYIKDNNLPDDFNLNYKLIQKEPKENDVNFVKYLFQKYPKTMYKNFIENLFQDNKFDRINVAFIIIMYNLKSFHQAFNDFQKEKR